MVNMKNKFNLNEEEKNRIRGMYNLSEQTIELPPMPEGCEKCLTDAIPNKYKSKANDIIIAVNEFMSEGKLPTMDQLMDILEGVELADAFTIGGDILACEMCMPEIGTPQMPPKTRSMTKHKSITEGDRPDNWRELPGYNPEAFYGDGSLDKIRKFAEEQDSEISTEDIVDELTAIYSYSQDGATDLVNSTLENLLYKLGGFKDDVNESKQSIREQSNVSRWTQDEKNNLISKIDEIHRILTTPSKPWNK